MSASRGRGLLDLGFQAPPPTPIESMLDNRVVGGQIGVIGWCGKTGLVGRDASWERKKWNCAL